MLLAYDLATIIVKQMAENWSVFTEFTLTASTLDAGAQAAQHCMGVSLGSYVCMMLNKDYSPEWEPLTYLSEVC